MFQTDKCMETSAFFINTNLTGEKRGLLENSTLFIFIWQYHMLGRKDLAIILYYLQRIIDIDVCNNLRHPFHIRKIAIAYYFQ